MNLDDLECLAKAATPGQWDLAPQWGPDTRSVKYQNPAPGGYTGFCAPSADAAFIAACNPETVLVLISRLRAAEAVCDAADTHIHDRSCASPVGCNCEMLDLTPSVSTWRQNRVNLSKRSK